MQVRLVIILICKYSVWNICLLQVYWYAVSILLIRNILLQRHIMYTRNVRVYVCFCLVRFSVSVLLLMLPTFVYGLQQHFWNVFVSACTTTYIIQASWALEQIFTVSSIKLSQNGRIQFVLMEASGLSPSRRRNLIRAGSIPYAFAFEVLLLFMNRCLCLHLL